MSTNGFDEANALLMGSSEDRTRPAFTKDDRAGTAVVGTLVALETRQARHLDTGRLLYWAGPGKPPSDKETDRPVMQIVATVQTDQQDDPEDDGLRAIYLEMGLKAAVRDALKQAGVSGLAEGGQLDVVYTGKAGKGNHKTYDATYTAPDAAKERLA